VFFTSSFYLLVFTGVYEMYEHARLHVAGEEYHATAKWYDKQLPGLGNRFIEMVEGKLELISRYPERYPKRKRKIQRSFSKYFPLHNCLFFL